MIKNDDNKLTINFHLVENQLFYAPLILAVGDACSTLAVGDACSTVDKRKIKENTEFYNYKKTKCTYKFHSKATVTKENPHVSHYFSDYNKKTKKGIIPLMFDKEFKEQSSGINLFISGSKELFDYIEYRQKHESNFNVNDHIVVWHVLVNRLPIIPIYKNSPLQPQNERRISFFPKDTTLSDTFTRYYKKENNDYMDLMHLNKRQSFLATMTNLKNDKCNYAFSTGSSDLNDEFTIDYSFNLIPEPLAFTCIYGFKDDFDVSFRKKYLHDFFNYVELYSEALFMHEYYEGKNNLFDSDAPFLMKILFPKDKITKEKCENLKKQIQYFARQRIWYFELKTGSILESKNILSHRIKGKKENIDLVFAPIRISEDREDALLKSSKISSVAAVISRNMSHNIGSHTLVRLNKRQLIEEISPQFKRVDKIFDDYKKVFLNKFFVDGKEPIKVEDEEFSTEGKISAFNSFLQGRMDFVADIVTSVPSLENSIQFGDMLKTFEKNVLLNNTISGVDDLTVNLKCEQKYRDMFISFPNDQLGCQAFYIILENIIRNCAKHGSYFKKDDGKSNLCTITIEIEEFGPDRQFYEVKIFDNDNDNDRRKELKLFEIVQKRNIAIDKSILDETGGLRHGDWGMLEMKICAAYLRKIEPSEIDNEKFDTDNDKNLIKAFSNDYPTGFGYKFLLMKPKEVLIIDFEDSDVESIYDKYKNLENDLLKKGIWIKKGKDLFNDKGEYCGEVFNHDFMIVITNKVEEIDLFKKEKVKNSLPIRVLIEDKCDKINDEFYGKYNFEKLKKKLIEELNSEDANNKPILNYTWECWCLNLAEKYQNKIKINERDWFSNYENYPQYAEKKAYFRSHGAEWEENKMYFYFEPFTGTSKMQDILDEAESFSFIKPLYQVRILETVNNRIGIIDERIQSLAYTLDYTMIKDNKDRKNDRIVKLSKIFEQTNIMIPNPNDRKDEYDFNLSSQDFKIINFDKKKNVKESIEKWFEDYAKNIDFLIIHLGIIEKLVDEPNKKEDINIEEYVKNHIVINNPKIKIIIISGRGKPHNLPKNALFMNYSTVSHFLILNRSKFHLNKLLFTARRLK